MLESSLSVDAIYIRHENYIITKFKIILELIFDLIF